MIHLPPGFDATLLLHDFVKFSLPFVSIYALLTAYSYLKQSSDLISGRN